MQLIFTYQVQDCTTKDASGYCRSSALCEDSSQIGRFPRTSCSDSRLHSRQFSSAGSL